MTVDMITPRALFYRKPFSHGILINNDNKNDATNDCVITSKVNDQEMEICVKGKEAHLYHFNMFNMKHVLTCSMDGFINSALFTCLSNTSMVNNASISTFEKFESIKPNSIALLADKSIKYCNFNGKIQTCNTPCSVQNAWAVRNGLFIERKKDSHMTEASSHFTMYFTTHHLSEFTPVVFVDDNNHRGFINDIGFRVVAICQKSLLLLAYDVEHGKFSLWLIRDAIKSDYAKLYKESENGCVISPVDQSCRSRISQKLDYSIDPDSSILNIDSMMKSRAKNKSIAIREKSVLDLDTRSPFVKSLLSVTNPNEGIDLWNTTAFTNNLNYKVNSEKRLLNEPLYPKVCLELLHVFRRLSSCDMFGPPITTMHSNDLPFHSTPRMANKKGTTKVSTLPKAFFMKDMCDGNYLCVLKPSPFDYIHKSKMFLFIIQYEFPQFSPQNLRSKNNIRTFSVVQQTRLSVLDACYLEGIRMMIVLDDESTNWDLRLYSGSMYVCKISLMQDLIGLGFDTSVGDNQILKDKYISGLSNGVDCSVVLECSKNKEMADSNVHDQSSFYIRMYLPSLTVFRVPLVKKTVELLKTLLPNHVCMILLTKWYVMAPHNENPCAQSQSFLEFLLEQVGFRTRDQRASHDPENNDNNSQFKRFKPNLSHDSIVMCDASFSETASQDNVSSYFSEYTLLAQNLSDCFLYPYARFLLLSLHIIYEAEKVHTELEKRQIRVLACFNARLAFALGSHHFIEYYLQGSPSLWHESIKNTPKLNPSDLIGGYEELGVPDWQRQLVLLTNQHKDGQHSISSPKYPVIPGVNDDVINLISIWLVGFEKSTNYASYFCKLDSLSSKHPIRACLPSQLNAAMINNVPNVKEFHQRIVTFLSLLGINREKLDAFNPGLVSCLNMSIWCCNTRTPGSFPDPPPYWLMGRDDLEIQRRLIGQSLDILTEKDPGGIKERRREIRKKNLSSWNNLLFSRDNWSDNTPMRMVGHSIGVNTGSMINVNNASSSTASHVSRHDLLGHLEGDPAVQMLHSDCRLKEAYLLLQTRSMLEISNYHLPKSTMNLNHFSLFDQQNIPTIDLFKSRLECCLKPISHNRTVALPIGRGMIGMRLLTRGLVHEFPAITLNGRYEITKSDEESTENVQRNPTTDANNAGTQPTTSPPQQQQPFPTEPTTDATNSIIAEPLSTPATVPVDNTGATTYKPITIQCPSLTANNSQSNSSSWCNWPEFHNGVAIGLQFDPDHTELNQGSIIDMIKASVTEYRASLGAGCVSSTAIANATNATINAAQLTNGFPLSSDLSKINLPPLSAGLIFGLGLNGHLDKLSITFLAKGLKSDSELTNLAFLLGACMHRIGSRDSELMKFVHFHYRSLLPSSVYWGTDGSGSTEAYKKHDPNLVGAVDIDGYHLGLRSSRYAGPEDSTELSGEQMYNQWPDRELPNQSRETDPGVGNSPNGDYVPPMTRISGMLAVGLLNFRSGDRGLARTLLRELGLGTRCWGTDQCCGPSSSGSNAHGNNNNGASDGSSNNQNTTANGPATIGGPEYHSLVAFSAAISAGLVLLGMGDEELLSRQQNPIELERLLRYLNGGTRFWEDHMVTSQNVNGFYGDGDNNLVSMATSVDMYGNQCYQRHQSSNHRQNGSVSNNLASGISGKQRHSFSSRYQNLVDLVDVSSDSLFISSIHHPNSQNNPNHANDGNIDSVVFTARPVLSNLDPANDMETSSDDIGTAGSTPTPVSTNNTGPLPPSNNSPSIHHSFNSTPASSYMQTSYSHQFLNSHLHPSTNSFSLNHQQQHQTVNRIILGSSPVSNSNSKKPHPLTNNPPTFKTIKVLEQDCYNIDMTGPCSALSLGLIFMATENPVIARHLSPPATQYELDGMRSPVMCIREIGRNLIMWKQIGCSHEWVQAQIPEFIKNSYLQTSHGSGDHTHNGSCNDGNIDADNVNMNFLSGSRDVIALNDAYLEMLIGCLFAMGLKYAGTEKKEARDTFVYYLEELAGMKEWHHNTQMQQANDRPDQFLNSDNTNNYQLTHLLNNLTMRVKKSTSSKQHVDVQVSSYTLHWALSTIYLSCCMIMAGSGDLYLLQLGRYLRSIESPESIRNYGVYQAYSSGIGLLFLGGGKLTLSNSMRSAALLSVAFYPRFPSHYSSSRYHLQALRHLYVLATRPRTLCAIDVQTNQTIPITALVKFKDGRISTNHRYLRYPPESMYSISEVEIFEENDRYSRQLYKPHTHSWKLLRESLYNGGYFFIQKSTRNAIEFDYLNNLKIDTSNLSNGNRLLDIKCFLEYLNATTQLNDKNQRFKSTIKTLEPQTKIVDYFCDHFEKFQRIFELVAISSGTNSDEHYDMQTFTNLMNQLESEHLLEFWSISRNYFIGQATPNSNWMTLMMI